MSDYIKVTTQQWLRYSPPPSRDVRKVFESFWSIERAEAERRARSQILQKGSKEDRKLSRRLNKAKRGRAADVMCCPLAARRFQIFVVGRGLKIGKNCDSIPIGLTLIDPALAVPFDKAAAIDWRKLHLQLRRRLERSLGKDVVVFGMGEIEADDLLRVWQPHHHLVAYGASAGGLQKLRAKHYRSAKGDDRLMRLTTIKDAGWLSYISKLMAFRKIKARRKNGSSYVQRKRLKPAEFRQYMHYLARRQPTASIFAMNCTVTKKEGRGPGLTLERDSLLSTKVQMKSVFGRRKLIARR